jgi:hypothetical protein
MRIAVCIGSNYRQKDRKIKGRLGSAAALEK